MGYTLTLKQKFVFIQDLRFIVLHNLFTYPIVVIPFREIGQLFQKIVNYARHTKVLLNIIIVLLKVVNNRIGKLQICRI